MASHGRRTELERTADAGKAVYTALGNILKKITLSLFSVKGQESHSIQMFSNNKQVFAGVLQNNELKVIEGKVSPAMLRHLEAVALSNPGTQLGGPNGADLKLLINQTPVLASSHGVVALNQVPIDQRPQLNFVQAPTPVNLRDQFNVNPSAEQSNQVSEQFNRGTLSTPPIEQSPIIILKQSLPRESVLHKLVSAFRQWAKNLNPTERSFSQDLRNLNTLQQAKYSLALMGKELEGGGRTWSGQTYSLSETNNGKLMVFAKNRGLILEFDKNNGSISGKANQQDFRNFEKLNTFARQSPLFQENNKDFSQVPNTTNLGR